MKYIDAEKLTERVTKLITSARQNDWPIAEDYLRRVIDIIKSLQQERSDVDLEKAFAHEYAIYHLPNFIVASIADGTELIDFIYKTARHFYEFGLNAGKKLLLNTKAGKPALLAGLQRIQSAFKRFKNMSHEKDNV